MSTVILCMKRKGIGCAEYFSQSMDLDLSSICLVKVFQLHGTYGIPLSLFLEFVPISYLLIFALQGHHCSHVVALQVASDPSIEFVSDGHLSFL